MASEIEESLGAGSFEASVAALALAKARAVAARVAEGVVLGADTVVVIDGVALGKPVDGEDAKTMLRRLRGRAHDVVTGVAVVDAARGREESRADVTRVVMADVSDDVVDAYVASGEPLDKAGAYAIQGRGGALVVGFVGSYSNVVGLPLGVTAELLRRHGVPINAFGEGPERWA